MTLCQAKPLVSVSSRSKTGRNPDARHAHLPADRNHSVPRQDELLAPQAPRLAPGPSSPEPTAPPLATGHSARDRVVRQAIVPAAPVFVQVRIVLGVVTLRAVQIAAQIVVPHAASKAVHPAEPTVLAASHSVLARTGLQQGAQSPSPPAKAPLATIVLASFARVQKEPATAHRRSLPAPGPQGQPPGVERKPVRAASQGKRSVGATPSPARTRAVLSPRSATRLERPRLQP